MQKSAREGPFIDAKLDGVRACLRRPWKNERRSCFIKIEEAKSKRSLLLFFLSRGGGRGGGLPQQQQQQAAKMKGSIAFKKPRASETRAKMERVKR